LESCVTSDNNNLDLKQKIHGAVLARAPFVLLLVCLLVFFATPFLPPEFKWLIPLSLPCIALSMLWSFRVWLNSRRANKWIIVDGSNVMHWNDSKPDLSTLRQVLAALKRAGLRPGVVFDANVGYKIAGRFMDDRALSRALGLPVNQVMVAPKGTPADPLILQAARDSKTRVVTNDQFRDWADDYPDVLTADRLTGGGFKHGKLWLSL